MKQVITLLLLIVVVLGTGCPKGTPKQPAIFTERLIRYQVDKFDEELESYECAAHGQTFNVNKNQFEDCAAGTQDEETATRIRNDIIYRLIRVIDHSYFEFENDLYVKRSTGSFLADITDLGANFAATITNGERAKTIINAAVIAFRGGRKSGSMHYFQEQTADILITKMQTSRNRVLADMIQQLKSDSSSAYSLEAALGDTIRYFFAGTLPRALQQLRQDTNVAAQTAADEVREVKGLPEPGLATKKTRDDAVHALRKLNALASQIEGTDKEKQDSLKHLQDVAKDLEKDTTLKANLEAEGVSSGTVDAAKLLAAIRRIRKEKAKKQDAAALVLINAAIIKGT